MACEDAPCCGCCGPENDFVSPELAEEMEMDELDCDEPWDGYTDAEADADTLASAGMGTDEDYGCFEMYDDMACDMACEGYDEN